MEDFVDLTEMNLEIVGETAFVTGTFEGVGVTKYGGNLTSCKDGKDGSAFIASFDMSGTDGPVANWMKLIGCGEGLAVRISGDSLFVAGELKQDAVASALTPATGVGAATCTLAGNLDGYLARACGPRTRQSTSVSRPTAPTCGRRQATMIQSRSARTSPWPPVPTTTRSSASSTTPQMAPRCGWSASAAPVAAASAT